MEFLPGHKVKYNFPNPNSPNKKHFFGTVDFVGETFITIRDEANTFLKVTYKNFHLLEYDRMMNRNIFPDSDNYFG